MIQTSALTLTRVATPTIVSRDSKKVEKSLDKILRSWYYNNTERDSGCQEELSIEPSAETPLKFSIQSVVRVENEQEKKFPQSLDKAENL